MAPFSLCRSCPRDDVSYPCHRQPPRALSGYPGWTRRNRFRHGQEHWRSASPGRGRFPLKNAISTCICRKQFQVDAVVPLVPEKAPSPSDLVPAIFSKPDAGVSLFPGDVSLGVSPVPGPGDTLDLGAVLRVANQPPVQLAFSLATALFMALLFWKTAPFWSWLAGHETSGWLCLSAFWWLCLEPGWLGVVIAAWACLMRHSPARNAPTSRIRQHSRLAFLRVSTDECGKKSWQYWPELGRPAVPEFW